MDDLEDITERAEQARQIMLGTPDTLDATVVFAALADVDSLLSELRRVKEDNERLREQGGLLIEALDDKDGESARLREDYEGLQEHFVVPSNLNDYECKAEARLREIEKVARDVIERLPKQHGDLGEAIKELRNALQPQTEKED